MWSITLLCILISQTPYYTRGTETEEHKEPNQSIENNNVKYVGPIVYSNNQPPVVLFPTPPPPQENNEQSIVSSGDEVEYVPFPYQELPILIYKSNNNPPIHVVHDDDQQNSSLPTPLDKRYGEFATNGADRVGRALKSWSQFKVFNENPIVMEAPKWTLSNGNSNLNMQSLYNGNTSGYNSDKITFSNAPHIVYSGHPPIHVFPQPIIFKEQQTLGDYIETSPSEANNLYVPIKDKSKIDGDLLAAASNSYDSDKTSSYAYGPAPAGTGKETFGFRVRTRGNQHDTDYSGSQNYDNYDDTYGSPQKYTDESSDQSQEDNYGKSTNNYESSTQSDQLDKDYRGETRSRYPDAYTRYRKRYREKYPSYNAASSLSDWDTTDNSWLTSLFGSGGYSRWPMRYRRPFGAASTDALAYAMPLNYDVENLGLYNQPLRTPTLWNGLSGLRPASSMIRPTYFSNLLGYRPRPMMPPYTPYGGQYYGRYNPSYGAMQSGSSISPVGMRPYGYSPSLLSMPTFSYPMRVPYSPMYRYRPSYSYPVPPNGDLAFAESNRKPNTSNKFEHKKYNNNKDDMIVSSSINSPSYSIASNEQTAAQKHTKPPIIIYQGIRPPVHVYHQPETQLGPQGVDLSDTVKSFMPESKSMEYSKPESFSTVISTTDNPYSHLYNTEESKSDYDDNSLKSSSLYFSNQRSAFTPRVNSNSNAMSDNWLPIKHVDTDQNKNNKKTEINNQNE